MQHTIGADVVFDGLESRIFHTQLSEQQRLFFSRLSLVVLGSVDDAGNPWATVVSDNPGFLTSPDARTLRIGSTLSSKDPASAGLGVGSSIAVLGIDFETRRRYRLNGEVTARKSSQLDVRAAQVFGNCPKYIRVRHLIGTAPRAVLSEGQVPLSWFDDEARSLIEHAETFFVASYADPEKSGRQVDVSHRGGPPGFVAIGEDGSLTIPDYSGNRFFNTLGNFLVNPVAGLTFVDFQTGTLLQLSGTVKLVLDDPAIDEHPGAERLWKFAPRLFVRRRGALGFQRP